MTSLELPKVEKVGDYLLYDNRILTTLKVSNVQKIGQGFLYKNRLLDTLEQPKAETIGNSFLYKNIGMLINKLSILSYIGVNIVRFFVSLHVT